MRLSSRYSSLTVAGLLAISIAIGAAQAPASPQAPPAPAPAGQPAARGQGAAIPPWAILRAPAGVKEGDTWIPEMPAMDTTVAPPGGSPDGHDGPRVPATLRRLPRIYVTRAK
jgi:hypothetical protein